MLAEDIIKDICDKERPEWVKHGVEEHYDQIVDMYLKEVKHLRHLKDEFSFLGFNFKNISKFKYLKFLRSDENELKETTYWETEEDLAKLALKNVDDCFERVGSDMRKVISDFETFEENNSL